MNVEKMVKDVIAQTNGRIFSVKFRKKDDSIRTMNCRLGVVSHLKGGKRTVPDSYVVVYDLQSCGYRSINPATVSEIHVDGKVITIQ